MNKNNIERFDADINTGLTNEQVLIRKKQKLVNNNKPAHLKSVVEIIFKDVFNFYNIVFCAVALVMFFYKIYVGIIYSAILICVIAINLFQDIKARHVPNESNRKAIVIRDGKKQEINADELVIDDILLVEKDSVIYVDGIILQGNITLDESSMTGNSAQVYKTVNQDVVFGSIVINGEAFIKINDFSFNGLNDRTKKIKKQSAKLSKSINAILLVIGVITSLLIITLGINRFLENRTNYASSIVITETLVNFITTIIPVCLCLIISIVLLIRTLGLSKKKIKIQDFTALESFANVDTVCFDKTGTITDGTLVVKKIIPLNAKYLDGYIAQNIANVLRATNDKHPIALALSKQFDLELAAGVNVALPFNSVNKYFGASFKGGKTFIIGEPQYMPLSNKAGVIKRCDEYIKDGYRVVVLAEGKDLIKDNKYPSNLEAIVLILLKDHIRDSAVQTINWLKQNNINIKIISGDNALITSSIAAEAGIPNSDLFISVKGLSISETKELAGRYTVFADATATQKEAIIMALQESEKNVAMVGNGDNDILALRRSNCSIVMNDSADSIKKVSQVTLTDSNLSHLKEILEQGRRVVNNTQKILPLFLIKALTTLVYILIFAIASLISKEAVIRCPFTFNNLLIWDFIICGVSMLFIVFEKSDDETNSDVLPNVFKQAVPASVVSILLILVFFLAFIMQEYGFINFGVYTRECASAMSIITFNVLGLIYLYKVCLPFNGYRRIVLIATAIVSLLLLVASGAIAYLINNGEDIILNIPFMELNGPSYLFTAIAVLLFGSVYLFISQVISIKKGENDNED